MSTSKNAKLLFESGQTVVDYTAMDDSGDHAVHTVSGGTVFSNKSGFEPQIRPNGVVSGRNLITPHTTTETISVAAVTAYALGVLLNISMFTRIRPREIVQSDVSTGTIVGEMYR